MLSASSKDPSIIAGWPHTTMPLDAYSVTPDASSSLFIALNRLLYSANIISLSAAFDILFLRESTDTIIFSSFILSSILPCSSFNLSAVASGMFKPCAIAFVILSPPKLTTFKNARPPSKNIVISDKSAPISSNITPNDLSWSETDELDVAIPEISEPSIPMPACLIAFLRLSITAIFAVTIYISVSSFIPNMPAGCLIPFSPSTTKSLLSV